MRLPLHRSLHSLPPLPQLAPCQVRHPPPGRLGRVISPLEDPPGPTRGRWPRATAPWASDEFLHVGGEARSGSGKATMEAIAGAVRLCGPALTRRVTSEGNATRHLLQIPSGPLLHPPRGSPAEKRHALSGFLRLAQIPVPARPTAPVLLKPLEMALPGGNGTAQSAGGKGIEDLPFPLVLSGGWRARSASTREVTTASCMERFRAQNAHQPDRAALALRSSGS